MSDDTPDDIALRRYERSREKIYSVPTPPPPPPKADAWEQLENESSEQFLCFMCYRDMPIGNVATVAFAPDYKGSKLPSITLHKWAEKFNWAERRAAYHLSVLKIQETERLAVLRVDAANSAAETAVIRSNIRRGLMTLSERFATEAEDPGRVINVKLLASLMPAIKVMLHEEHLSKGEATSISGETSIKSPYDAESPRILAAREADAREEALRQAELEADAVAEELPPGKQKRIGE